MVYVATYRQGLHCHSGLIAPDICFSFFHSLRKFCQESGQFLVIWVEGQAELYGVRCVGNFSKRMQCFCLAEVAFAPVSSELNDDFGIRKSRNIVACLKKGS